MNIVEFHRAADSLKTAARAIEQNPPNEHMLQFARSVQQFTARVQDLVSDHLQTKTATEQALSQFAQELTDIRLLVNKHSEFTGTAPIPEPTARITTDEPPSPPLPTAA